MQIIRDYVHKTFGNIGSVTFDAPEGDYAINGQVVPTNTVRHLLGFALQTLQDAYAGAETGEQARENWAKKLAKLLDGSMGVRSVGAGLSAVETIVHRLARTMISGAMRAQGQKAPKADDEIWETILPEFLGMVNPASGETFEVELTREAIAEIEKKKTMAASVDLASLFKK